KEHLASLIEKTILTRKFREFAGDKYEIQTHNVTPGPGEKAVYTKILKEFCEICSLYFNSTGDTKKEASLRLIRQIMLLIRACSIPNKIKGYTGSPFPCKTRYIAQMVQGIPGKVAIGCTTLEAMEMYVDYMGMYFPKRPLFVIHGEVTFNRRQKIIEKFEASQDGILICTQQSLKSSANIPSCNDVILESLQWNIPKMEQFYFRFIRLDSKEKKQVHYVTYDESIEQNLIALVLTKERLNEFIKTGEVMEQSEIFNEFDISPSLIENLLQRKRDEDGNFYITWGDQKVA
ncbi:MAG: helicase, partial [Alistipes sp.]|uniref:helicase-related protein n=1 Tax=Alistipes sp. TaxID=1872444 RepID=UPI0025C11D9A